MDTRDRVRQQARRVLQRVTGESGHVAAPETLTRADLAAAYRLLLRREPDEGGLRHYEARLSDGSLTRDDLVGELLQSPEFRRYHPGLIVPSQTTEAIDLGAYQIVIDPSDWSIGATIAADRSYEPDVTAKIQTLLQPGQTFIDVGANVGWFSLLGASQVGPTGRVIAIEPNPANCALIRDSAQRNAFQIDVLAAAIADDRQWLALQTDATNGWMVAPGPLGPDTEPIPCSYIVPSFTLDDLLVARSLEQVHLIKVDVEGFEPRVFSGATRLLTEHRPTIVFEWFPNGLRHTGTDEPTLPLTMLREHGYELSVIGYDRGPLSDPEIDKARIEMGRELLELLAQPVH